MKGIFFITIVFFCWISTTSRENRDYVISAKNLKDQDWYPETPDPYLKIFKVSTDRLVHKTDVIDTTTSPTFSVQFHWEENESYRFEFWGSDSYDDDLMGKVTLKADKLPGTHFLSDPMGASIHITDVSKKTTTTSTFKSTIPTPAYTTSTPAPYKPRVKVTTEKVPETTEDDWLWPWPEAENAGETSEKVQADSRSAPTPAKTTLTPQVQPIPATTENTAAKQYIAAIASNQFYCNWN